MGDCHLRLSFSGVFQKTFPNKGEMVSPLSLRLASDATVADVLATTVGDGPSSSSLRAFLLERRAKLWDCTYYPPKDVTQQILEQFVETFGPKSLTLFDAGWFPSGSLVVTSPEEGPPQGAAAIYDDVQYNMRQVEDSTIIGATAVQLKHHSGPVLPSQVLQSATRRFEGVDAPDTDDATARRLRHETAMQRREREEKRQKKLQERIRQLDASKGGVAAQVQRMLVKSRAVGRPNLAEQDRVYLRVVMDKSDDDKDAHATTEESFYYFSRQDVVGKVLSQTVLAAASGKQAELLVQLGGREDDPSYQRLPHLMRLYEALGIGYLKNFDRVVVRIYDPQKEEPTTTIDVNPFPATGGSTPIAKLKNDAATVAQSVKQDNIGDSTTTHDATEIFTDKAMTQALAATEKSKKTATKKPSAALAKVRQMQMKSKAKGDTKRVKMPDRFFVEVGVACRQADGTVTLSTPVAPYFVAHTDALSRLVKDGWVTGVDANANTQFVKPLTDDGAQFQRIPDPSLSVQHLTAQGILCNFDRILVIHEARK